MSKLSAFLNSRPSKFVAKRFANVSYDRPADFHCMLCCTLYLAKLGECSPSVRNIGNLDDSVIFVISVNIVIVYRNN